MSSKPFTVWNIKAALNNMDPKRYIDLGEMLNLPRKSVAKHEKNWPHDSGRVLTELINEWLDSDPDASWENLREALVKINLSGLVKGIGPNRSHPTDTAEEPKNSLGKSITHT